MQRKIEKTISQNNQYFFELNLRVLSCVLFDELNKDHPFDERFIKTHSS
jgi:hypothetical protein